jgi:hypothetical protein
MSAMHFSEQQFVYRNLRLDSVNFPNLMSNLADDQFTGCAVLATNDHNLSLMFNFGSFLGATFDGMPVTAGGEAKAVSLLREGGASVDVIELPSQLVEILQEIALGTNLTGELPTELVNLKGLADKYREMVSSGAVVLYKRGSPCAVIVIEDGEWLFATPEQEFRQRYDEKGATLALFSFDRAHQAKAAVDLQKFFNTFKKSVDHVREALIRTIKDYYPTGVETLVNLVEREFKGPRDLEPVLARVEEYIKLFVDSGIKNGFIADLRETAARELQS